MRANWFSQKTGRRVVTRQWLGQPSPNQEAKVVTDHRGWPYFAQRFGLDIVEHLEPPPGVSPTMQHLKALTLMKTQGVKVGLATASYNPHYARFVSEITGLRDC